MVVSQICFSNIWSPEVKVPQNWGIAPRGKILKKGAARCYAEGSSGKLRLIILSLILAPGKKGGAIIGAGTIWGWLSSLILR